ncbi:MAG: SurA N-terminal domain-containing protein, partial [Campylobacterales bacterium]|nr:SurA N-terminal domain-containing protein [Campylobacterales bacterium]
NFDEEKANQFGLKKQALNQLTQQSLILNLAKEYDLKVSDEELLEEIKQQEFFFKDGAFDKGIYKEVLSRNNLSIKEYEDDVRKQLLIQKTLKLFPTDVSENEKEILSTLLNIADKISYKILDPLEIPVDVEEKELKEFWEGIKQQFMSDVSYDIEYIKHENISGNYDEKTITAYYEENKNSIKDENGKIIPLEQAKEFIVSALNEKATKKEALKGYIDYKKNQLEKSLTTQTVTISSAQNIFNNEILEKISDLTITSPFLKPILSDGYYYTIKLLKINPSQIKSFEDVKNEVTPLYEKQKRDEKLLELAKKSVGNFKGKTTNFITSSDIKEFSELEESEASEFLMELFNQTQKDGFITLRDGKIILFSILEQKLLKDAKDVNDIADSVAKLKNGIFNEGLINNLQKKYKTEIFIEGL